MSSSSTGADGSSVTADAGFERAREFIRDAALRSAAAVADEIADEPLLAAVSALVGRRDEWTWHARMRNCYLIGTGRWTQLWHRRSGNSRAAVSDRKGEDTSAAVVTTGAW